MMTSTAISIDSKSLLHRVMQTVVEGVAITDRRGQLVYANKALEKLLGYGAGELVGQPCSRLFRDQLRTRSESWQTGTADESIVRYEARLRCKDGSLVPVLASSCSLSDGDRDQGALTTFTDLRESRPLPPEAQQQVQPDFVNPQVASIIHELSNSLTILFLQTQWLSTLGFTSPPLDEKLSVIRDQTRRMMEMVDALRATADPSRFQIETTDVNALIERTLELQRHQLQSEGIQVATALQPNLPVLGADPYKLQQVLVNLINNARQAIATTGQAGKLTISTQVAKTRGNDNSPWIRIGIADDGPGIPRQILPHIFEPFYTTRPASGMGLGLSICEQIVRKHGGSIRAENNAEGGATFFLDLPTVACRRYQEEPLPASRSAAGPRQAKPSITNARHHILVVDHEASVARSVGQILNLAGFEVSTAFEPRQALELVDQNHIDLILSDLNMPRMSGAQFWNAVRKCKPRLASRIIFSVGKGASHRAQAFLQFSGCACIEKPYEPEDLLRLVRTILPNGREVTMASG